MALSPVPIFGSSSGLIANVKPLLMPQDGFSLLENAYVFRERVLKRQGLQLLGRLQRDFADENFFLTGASPWSFNILVVTGYVSAANNANPGKITTSYPHGLTNGDKIIITGIVGATGYNNTTFTITVVDDLNFTVGVDASGFGAYTSGGFWISNHSLLGMSGIEPEAQIAPGSVIISISGGQTFTDQGNGLLTTALPVSNYGYINYVTGDVVLTHTAGANVATTITFSYFPALPAMTIASEQLAAINDERSIFFDTRYAYIYSNGAFQEFIPGTVWDGTDYEQFWSTNYPAYGTDNQASGNRLFFVTNNSNTPESPMRYTDGSTWNTFQPLISAPISTQNLGNVTTPWTSFSGTISATPIVPGTVSIIVGTITFTDDGSGTLIGSPSTNSGTVDYTTGAVTLTISPALTADTAVIATSSTTTDAQYLLEALILIPYYGRLLALNTTVGVPGGASINVFNGCRFSAIGNALSTNAWRTDLRGKGGSLDAPTNEAIISCAFIKNTLVVFFEESTWQLRYVGNYGLPFLWERVASDFGSDSTFSTITFDKHALTVGARAIIAGNSVDVERIDLQIPDQIFQFSNDNNGVQRVSGVRDYEKELVYWCYPQADSDLVYPSQVLVYNYRNNTYGIFRDNVTCFGLYQEQGNVNWSSSTVLWDDSSILWSNSNSSNLLPQSVSGNQKGYIHVYNESLPDEQSIAIDSCTITSSGSGQTLVISSVNNNILDGEFISLVNMTFIDTATNPPTAVTTDLNGMIFLVLKSTPTDASMQLLQWNGISYETSFNFTPGPTATFVYGEIILLPVMNIQTRDFNPSQEIGKQSFISRIDFLLANAPGNVSIQLFSDSAVNEPVNSITGNQEVETSAYTQGLIINISNSNPCVITSPGYDLETGDSITISNVIGMTELNNNSYTVTEVSYNTFSINVDSSGFNTYIEGGLFIKNSPSFFNPSADYLWHSFYATLVAQYIRIGLTYDNTLMNNIQTHSTNFELDAMNLWMRKAGKIVF